MKKIRYAINHALDLRDIFVFGGLGALGYGVWQINPSYSYMICGSILMLIGLGWLDRGPIK